MKEHKTSDEKAYMIRSLNKIENRTEFFELINKNRITCTPDGLNVDNNIDIAPEAYNQIGTSVVKDRLVQIERYKEAAFEKSMAKELSEGIPTERRDAFNERMKTVMELPSEERKEAMRQVIREFRGEQAVQGDQFDRKWTRVEENAQADVRKQVNKMVNNMEAKFQDDRERQAFERRIREYEQREANNTITPEERQELQRRRDFEELKNLSQRKVDGTILPEEEERLKNQIEKCARHRKEHFFQSSADHREGQPNRTDDATFKRDIRTFTNGQNERLCYRIDIEHVKTELTAIYGAANVNDINVRGQHIFNNMKIGEYDRLNRVMNEYGENSRHLLQGATNIANDQNLNGQVTTPYDFASVTEAINTAMVLLFPC